MLHKSEGFSTVVATILKCGEP